MGEKHDAASESIPFIPCDFCPEMFEKSEHPKVIPICQEFSHERTQRGKTLVHSVQQTLPFSNLFADASKVIEI